jgi:iron complex outermembrane receptor protein
MWGANAVNGVVNIITKTSTATQGGLMTAGTGDQGQSLGGLRYGGKLGASGSYRVFSKYGQDSSVVSGRTNLDGTNSLNSGFRADWVAGSKDTITAEGDLFRSRSGSAYDVFQLAAPFVNVAMADARASGGDFMVSWSHQQSERSKTTLRADFDHSSRQELVYGEDHSTLDVEFQHQLTVSESHELVWGVGLRDSLSHGSTGFNVAFSPNHRTDRVFSGFVQDQWRILDDRLSLILGSKFEHNNHSGFDVQPSARLLWTPRQSQTVWAAISRAVRTPSFTDESIRVNLAALAGPHGIPYLVTAFGNPLFKSETLLAFELGYRAQASKRLSVDVATFYSRYRRLQVTTPGAPYLETDPGPAHIVIPLYEGNGGHGESYGGEISSNWNVNEHWRLTPSYSYLILNRRQDASNFAVPSLPTSVQDPRNQFQLRSILDLSRRVQLDAAAFYAAALPGLSVAAYARVDARLGYRLRQDVEVSVAGRNLQGGRHQELISLGPYPSATVGRSFLLKLTWEF